LSGLSQLSSDGVNQRERGTQKDCRYPTSCCADQRRNPPLTYTLSDRGADRWAFGRDGAVVANVAGTLRTNNGDALRVAAVAGLGLIYEPAFLVAEDLQAGRLLVLHLDHPPMVAGHVQAVFPPDRHLPLKSRIMIDFLVEKFGGEAPWGDNRPTP